MAPVAAMFEAMRDLFETTPQGWTPVTQTVSSVSYSGNRSYTLTMSADVSATLSPGMRVRTTRTVTAPTYMGGAFNGTSHYFTKVTPTSTLSTVANNFTFMAHAELTSYPSFGGIMGRADATPANGIIFDVNTSGQVRFGVYNGGAANYRIVTTYQSLPLNKKTHVAASWASGTVAIYFDGLSVPVAAATTSGTAPTTAGTGGDFSIGRTGANTSSYFAGYISGAGAFDAVLSASTVRSYSSQVLSGSETNCICAWSLNNTGVNQQAAGTNDLTATGGVGYTSGRSPYGTDSNGVSAGTTDYALVQSVATTTVVVQVPEGCTIPTSGGVSAMSYSTQQAPYGFPSDRNKWAVLSRNNSIALFTPVNLTVYNLGGVSVVVPAGNWELNYKAVARVGTSAGVGFMEVTLGLGTTSASFTGAITELYSYNALDFPGTPGNVITNVINTGPSPVTYTSATALYLNYRINTSGTIYANQCGYYTTLIPVIVTAFPALL